MKKELFSDMNPTLQLLLMLAVIAVSSIVISVAAIIMAIPFMGIDNVLTVFLSGSTGFMRYMQIMQSIASFVLPPLTLAWMLSAKPFRWLHFNRPTPMLMVIAFLLPIVCQPLISWTVQFNSNAEFPEWMRTLEETNNSLMFAFLDTHNPAVIALNIIMIVLIPAFGEEMLFRGTMQPLLQKIFKNPHWAVWVTAFVFSTIHFQFLTFLSRLILGALFGYLLVYGKSIWYAVAGHLLNNLTSIIIFYYYRHTQPNINPLTQDGDEFGLPMVAASIILTGLLFYIFIRKKKSLILNNDTDPV
jgi:membrane protease YdiL (CAAX protease family)